MLNILPKRTIFLYRTEKKKKQKKNCLIVHIKYIKMTREKNI